MIRLTQERALALAGIIPADTLAFLCDPGVPELLFKESSEQEVTQ